MMMNHLGRNARYGSVLSEYATVGASLLVICLVVCLSLGQNLPKSFSPFFSTMAYQSVQAQLSPAQAGTHNSADLKASIDALMGNGNGNGTSTAGTNGDTNTTPSDGIQSKADQYRADGNTAAANLLDRLADRGDIIYKLLYGNMNVQDAIDRARAKGEDDEFIVQLQAWQSDSQDQIKAKVAEYLRFYLTGVKNNPAFQSLSMADQNIINALVSQNVKNGNHIPGEYGVAKTSGEKKAVKNQADQGREDNRKIGHGRHH